MGGRQVKRKGEQELTLKWTVTVLVTQSGPTPYNPWTVAHQAPLSMGFSRQEDWSGLAFLSPGHLPKPGFEPKSSTLWADSFSSEPALNWVAGQHKQRKDAMLSLPGRKRDTE